MVIHVLYKKSPLGLLILSCLLPIHAYAQQLVTVNDETFTGQCVAANTIGVVFMVDQSPLRVPYGEIKSLVCGTAIEVQTDTVKNIQAQVSVQEGVATANTRFGALILHTQTNAKSAKSVDVLSDAKMQAIVGAGDTPPTNGVPLEASAAVVKDKPIEKDKVSEKPDDLKSEFEQTYSFLRNERVFQSDRSLSMNLNLKHKIKPVLELSAAVPINYAQRTTYTDTITKNDSVGFGDLRVGLRYAPAAATANGFKFGASANINFPTGKNPYSPAPSNFEGQTNAAGVPIILDPRDPFTFQIGSGHYSFGAGMNVEYKSDPLVYYAGIDITKSLGKEYFQTYVVPGLRVAFAAGYGFLISDKATFIQQIFIQNESKWYVGGAPVFRSGGNPIAMRFALSHRIDKFTTIEPSVRFSLTNDGTSAIVSLGYSKKF
jgi:hypothetical protein